MGTCCGHQGRVFGSAWPLLTSANKTLTRRNEPLRRETVKERHNSLLALQFFAFLYRTIEVPTNTFLYILLAQFFEYYRRGRRGGGRICYSKDDLGMSETEVLTVLADS